MAKRGMAVIGLTGGIGSGKSTVAARMRRAGVPVIDADRVAREIVEPGSPALVEIERVFGAEVIATDGSLRRKALGAIVFSDPEKLATLNRITHPAILRLTQRRLADLASAGHPWAVYEAALILENGLSPGLDQLVAVVCDPNRQLERVMKRDGLSETDASARIASQTGNERKREAADHVLENDGELEALIVEVDALVERLARRYGAPLSDGSEDLV